MNCLSCGDRLTSPLQQGMHKAVAHAMSNVLHVPFDFGSFSLTHLEHRGVGRLYHRDARFTSPVLDECTDCEWIGCRRRCRCLAPAEG